MSRLVRFMAYGSLRNILAIQLTGRASVAALSLRASSVCVPRLRSHQLVSILRQHSTAADNNLLSIILEQGGLLLNLSWRDADRITSLYGIWLRHSCQCSECAADNGQSLIPPESIDPSVTVQSASISDNQLNLSWSSGHHGYIDIDWLKKKTSVDTTTNSVPPLATEVPRLSSVGLAGDEEKQWQWLHNLNEYGYCVLTDFGTNIGDGKKLAKLVYNVQPTVYGETFDVITEQQPKNLAYSTMGLNVHMDLDFYESPPGLQLLHCVKFDPCVVGGDSIILDAVHIAEEMRSKFPEHFDTFTRVPATNYRIHYNRDEPVDMTYYAPHISVDKSGKEDILPYYEAFKCFVKLINESKLKLKFHLQPGEVLTFNNRRVFHTREEFQLNGGVRYLQGTYVNIDEFQSKFKVLSNKLGKEDHFVRRVFNGSIVNIN